MKVAVIVIIMIAGAYGGPSAEAIQFIEGVALGLDDDLGNVTACTKDLNITTVDFGTGFALLEKGFHDKNIKEISAGLTDFGKGTQEIAKVWAACGDAKVAADIAKLAADIAKGPLSIFELVVKETVTIFHEKKELTTDFQQAISAWKAKNFRASGEATGKIVGVLLANV